MDFINDSIFYNKRIVPRPEFDQAVVTASGVIIPTQVSRGLLNGFSLPIWNSDTEELKYASKIIKRWDQVTDPIVNVYGWLSAPEDVGDSFKLQYEYECFDFCDSTIIVPETINTVSVDTEIIAAENFQYAPYCIQFSIDDTALENDCIIGARIRRVASAGTEIAGEFVVSYSDITFKTNKYYGDLS